MKMPELADNLSARIVLEISITSIMTNTVKRRDDKWRD